MSNSWRLLLHNTWLANNSSWKTSTNFLGAKCGVSDNISGCYLMRDPRAGATRGGEFGSRLEPTRRYTGFYRIANETAASHGECTLTSASCVNSSSSDRPRTLGVNALFQGLQVPCEFFSMRKVTCIALEKCRKSLHLRSHIDLVVYWLASGAAFARSDVITTCPAQIALRYVKKVQIKTSTRLFVFVETTIKLISVGEAR